VAAYEYSAALANFAAFVDRKTGIIRRVDVMKTVDPDPPVFLAVAEPCDTRPLTGVMAANRGAACSATIERALVRACGESIERYCAAFFSVRDLCLCTEREMLQKDRTVVRTAELYPFAEWQFREPTFPYRKAADTDVVRWVEGVSQSSGRRIWIPASCVYVPYLYDVDVEPFTHMPISTGLAAGRDFESCVRKGMLEIVERDALMIVWYARMPVPRIDPRTCFGVSVDVDALLSSPRNGTKWYLNSLTLDVDIPIISAALIDEGHRPLTSFGISADADPKRALLLAMEEAVLTRMLLNRSPEIVEDNRHVQGPLQTLRDHMLAHATSAVLRENLRFMSDAPPIVDFESISMRADPNGSVAESLRRAGFEAISVDVTTPDVRDFGFRVVRTVIPGMQPLDNDHRYRYFGGTRLTSVPEALGHMSLGGGTFNPDPHPFP
jgi:ribosomal protein S12 methylthiotransferase accessory factor